MKEKKMIRVNGFQMNMSHRLIDVDEAAMMLDYYRYGKQRNIRQRQVNYLVDMMRRELFLPFTVLVTYQCGNEIVLLDGNHRLTALVKAQLPQYFWVHDIIGDVNPADIYITYDMNSARTQMDFMRALGTFDNVESGYVRHGSAASAVKIIMTGSIFHPVAYPKDIDAALREWMPYFEQYSAAIQGGDMVTPLRPAAFVAAGAVTMRYCSVQAGAFWSGISRDDGLSRYDPRKRVVDLLRDKDSVVHRRGSTGTMDTLRVLSYYWNKFFAGEEVKRLPSEWPMVAAFNGTGWSVAHERMLNEESTNEGSSNRDS